MLAIQNQLIYQYISQQQIKSQVGSNKSYSRLMISGCILMIQWNQSQYIQMPGWKHQLIYQDGNQKQTQFNQQSEIFLIQIVIGIQIFMGQERSHIRGGTLKSETYLIQMTNLVGQTYLLSCQSQVQMIAAWEQMNQAQYQQVTIQSNQTGASLSAGIKYFQLSAQTTGLQLMGIAQIYKNTGSTEIKILGSFQREIEKPTEQLNEYNITISIAQIQIQITQSQKLGAAPFHQWSPDLYDEIPTILTMWMAVMPKQTIQLFQSNINKFLLGFGNVVMSFFIILGCQSQLIGSIGLGSQWRIKRFLAFSAIAHVGFQYQTYSTNDLSSFIFYLIIYGINSFLIFAILEIISNNSILTLILKNTNLSYTSKKNNQYNKTIIKGENPKQDIGDIDDLSGLFKQHPALAISLTISQFSLAGIPPLAGFFAKQQIISGILSYSFFLSFFFIIMSVISTANYLTVIKVINLPKPKIQIPFKLKIIESYIISIITTFLIFFYFTPGQTDLSINLMGLLV